MLNIDETSLSSWTRKMAEIDFGFIKGGGCPLTKNEPGEYGALIGLQKAPAIRPTLSPIRLSPARFRHVRP